MWGGIALERIALIKFVHLHYRYVHTPYFVPYSAGIWNPSKLLCAFILYCVQIRISQINIVSAIAFYRTVYALYRSSYRE
jgi:hypothetical protein